MKKILWLLAFITFATGTTISVAAETPHIKNSSLSCFENRYIRGCVRAYLSRDKKTVTVSATLRNHSNRTIRMALLTTCTGEYDNQCHQDRSDKTQYSLPNATILTDGKAVRAKSTRGASPYFKRWIDRNKADINNMTALDPNEKITLTYTFMSEKPIEASMYDFTAEAAMYIPKDNEKGKYKKRKFTISGTDVYFPIN